MKFSINEVYTHIKTVALKIVFLGGKTDRNLANQIFSVLFIQNVDRIGIIILTPV